MDGVRKAEGGGEGATGEIAWVPFGVGRSADGLHRRTGAPMAVCRASGVDGDGNLLLAQPDGSTVTVVAGEVTLQG